MDLSEGKYREYKKFLRYYEENQDRKREADEAIERQEFYKLNMHLYDSIPKFSISISMNSMSRMESLRMLDMSIDEDIMLILIARAKKYVEEYEQFERTKDLGSGI